MSDERIVIKQPTRGIARYMVWLPDIGGATEIGIVTHRTTGEWDAQRRDKSLIPLAFDTRREAVRALVGEFVTRDE